MTLATPAPPKTGDEGLDVILEQVATLGDQPLGDHAAVLDEAQSRLAGLLTGDRAP
ncbi:MAG: hypothetical protein LBE83_06815 [Propionibacteriaceae bacterium]|nr:hypothetical protein [Propionibacteriaceae bacterium]